jgi:hypothetical protein
MDKKNYQTYKITPDFLLEVDELSAKIVLSDADEAAVNQLWEEAEKQHAGLLFNGKMLIFSSFEEGKLTGRFIEYKYYRAQLTQPSLKSVLNIKPIAISCSCTYQNEILIGRRSESVTGFPGCYELVPSGGISLDSLRLGRIDLARQALIELEEEAGISSECVKSCISVVLIYEIDSATYEIYMEIKLQERGGDTNVRSTKEYSMLEWMPLSELCVLAEREKESFVPLSLYLIEHYLK